MANGEVRWWNVSGGGTIQAAVKLVNNDQANANNGSGRHHIPTTTSNTHNKSTANGTNNTTNGNNGYPYYGGNAASNGRGGTGVSTPTATVAAPAGQIPVAHATPAGVVAGGGYGATPVTYGAQTNASVYDPPPAYEVRGQGFVCVCVAFLFFYGVFVPFFRICFSLFFSFSFLSRNSVLRFFRSKPLVCFFCELIGWLISCFIDIFCFLCVCVCVLRSPGRRMVRCCNMTV